MPATGSIHRNVNPGLPEVTEGPRGGGNARPVGDLESRISKPSPQSLGFWWPYPGSTPFVLVLDGHGLQDRTRIEQPRRLHLGGETHQVRHRRHPVPCGRAVQRRPRHPRRPQHRLPQDLPKGMSVALATWSPSTSNPALEYNRRSPGVDVTRCSSNASPEVCARR